MTENNHRANDLERMKIWKRECDAVAKHYPKELSDYICGNWERFYYGEKTQAQ